MNMLLYSNKLICITKGGHVMGITFKEFFVAMETYGSEKIHQLNVVNGVSLPAFLANDVIFVHCGDYCKILDAKNNPRAEKLLNEKIRSIDSLLNNLLTLEKKYDVNLLYSLINQTYNKIFEELKIKNSNIKHYFGCDITGLNSLQETLLVFDDMVNPYGNDSFKLEYPIEYFDLINMSLDIKEEKNSDYSNVRISLVKDNTKIGFVNNKNGWYYYMSAFNDSCVGKDSGYTAISHYFNNGNDGLPVDEVVNLMYFTKDNVSENLSISIKNGLAWNPDNIGNINPVTHSQIECMVTHLKRCIFKAKQEILDYIII